MEGVGGQTDALSMDGGQEVCVSFYGSSQDNSSWMCVDLMMSDHQLFLTQGYDL